MNPKKITAGTVALAFGASALIAPNASALPDTFISPPGVSSNPGFLKCNVRFQNSVSNTQPGQVEAETYQGITLGTSNNPANTVYRPWITVSSDGGRIVESASVELQVNNTSKPAKNLDFTLTSTSKGSYDVPNVNPKLPAQIDVTGLAPVAPRKVTVAPGGSLTSSGTLGIDANTDTQTWAWDVTVPSTQAADLSSITSRVDAEVAPWPMENDDCLPLTPSSTESKPIIADGNEYDTGITVANGSASDFARLSGAVSVGGKTIAGAKVRVDAGGKVYVTLPKGATGEVDNDKPAHVSVELTANPRKETANHRYESYNSPQTLRVVGDNGIVTNQSPLFNADVPLAKFAPEYNSPQSVKPGNTIDVSLKTQPGNVRGAAVDATYTVTGAPKGWTAEPAADGTLKVTAPATAKGGDTAEFTVEVAYPDGSVDTLKPVVKVVDFDATVTTPGYDNGFGKVGTEVTLTQNTKLPGGSTFTITPGQDLGEWKATVDEATGKITVTIPQDAKPGDTQTILVDVTYPDGSTDKKVPAKVIVLNQPGYGTATDKPGETVTLPQTGKVVEGSIFEIAPNQDLGEWAPTVDRVTGEITVTIPQGAKPGETKDILVNVTDPNSGKPDTVTAKVIVHGAPEYPTVEKTPGDNVTLTLKTDNVPPESTYEITPGQDLGNWEPKIDQTTGKITVTVPGETKDGDTKDINVTVTYPSGKTDEVPARVTVKTPETTPAPTAEGETTTGSTVTVYPGATVELNPTVVIGDLNGTTFELEKGWKVPEGWTVTVDPKTGKVTIIPAKDATPGTKINIPVTITYPSGKTETRVIPAEVGKTAEGTIPYVPGQRDPLVVYIPEGGSKTEVKLPEGWTVTRTDGNSITLNVPEGTKPGVYEVVFPKTDGSGNVTVYVQVQDPADGADAEQGSSKNQQKCFANMSSESNPLLWLVPLGLLIAIGAPLAGPIGEELGKAAANVSAQMNIPNPLADLGFGGERRPQPEWMTQIQIEANRLQAQFGPEVTQAAAIGLSLAGLAAGLGVLAALCKDGELPGWASSSTEGSSQKDEADKPAAE